MVTSPYPPPVPLHSPLFSGTQKHYILGLASSSRVPSCNPLLICLSTLGHWGLPLTLCPCHCFLSLISVSSPPLFLFQVNKDLRVIFQICFLTDFSLPSLLVPLTRSDMRVPNHRKEEREGRAGKGNKTEKS